MNDGERRELLSLLRGMWTIRAFEEKVSELCSWGALSRSRWARRWRARSGGRNRWPPCSSATGPGRWERSTYRLRGHYEGDPAKYRELSEVADWKARDPLARFTRVLTERGAASDAEIGEAVGNARAAVEEAVRFALSSPWPTPDELTNQVFA